MPLLGYALGDGAIDLTWRIDATAQDTWRHLTSVGHLPEWLGQPRSGGFVSGDTLVVDHGDGYLCTSQVSAAEPGRVLDLTWEFPDEPTSHLTLLVETVADAQESDGPAALTSARATDLHLRHTGLGDLTASYLPGWITHLTYFEGSLEGAPLPFGAFWRLYATTERLTSSSPDLRRKQEP